jgi:hypothetical protein
MAHVDLAAPVANAPSFGGDVRTTNLDLVLATLVALGLPSLCAALFQLTGGALASLAVYYLLACVALVRWWICSWCCWRTTQSCPGTDTPARIFVPFLVLGVKLISDGMGGLFNAYDTWQLPGPNPNLGHVCCYISGSPAGL